MEIIRWETSDAQTSDNETGSVACGVCPSFTAGCLVVWDFSTALEMTEAREIRGKRFEVGDRGAYQTADFRMLDTQMQTIILKRDRFCLLVIYPHTYKEKAPSLLWGAF